MVLKIQNPIKFPHAIELFAFCYQVFEESLQANQKANEQALGQVIGFFPSETSQWKRGRKNVSQIEKIIQLSQFLNVPKEILMDIRDGVIDRQEAYEEFLHFKEELLFAQNTAFAKKERRDHQIGLDEFAQTLLKNALIHFVPVYLPELMSLFPFIQISPVDTNEYLAKSSLIKPGFYLIRYKKGEIRPHIRLAIVKEIAKIVLTSERSRFPQLRYLDSVQPYSIWDLTLSLLLPKDEMILEILKVSHNQSLFEHLSEVFWLPKFAIKWRLASILFEISSNFVFEQSSSHLITENLYDSKSI